MRSHPGDPAAHAQATHGHSAFLCGHCGTTVTAEALGTRQRNHCPRCLHSLHVDVVVGDRRSLCLGLMDPISFWVRHDEEVALLHRCRRCGVIRSNRIAGDDDPDVLGRLSATLRSSLEPCGGPPEGGAPDLPASPPPSSGAHGSPDLG